MTDDEKTIIMKYRKKARMEFQYHANAIIHLVDAMRHDIEKVDSIGITQRLGAVDRETKRFRDKILEYTKGDL